MGQVQSVFSCNAWSCARADVANEDLADPPYGAFAGTAPLSPGRASSHSGSVGSAESADPGYAQVLRPRSPSTETMRPEEARAGAARASSSAAGSGAAREPMEYADLMRRMGQHDVLVQLEHGGLECLMKARAEGSARYEVVPINRRDLAPLLPGWEWVDGATLEAAVNKSPEGFAEKHLRRTAYVLRSKRPQGLRGVAFASVWLPPLTSR
jgi:hypothetical protein